MSSAARGKVFPDPSTMSPGLVLRTWPTGETSVIASLLTRDHGYVRVIAKGARGPRSRLRSLVQPGSLCELEFSWREDRDLQYLRGGQSLASPLQDNPTLERSAYLMAMVEMLDRCRLDDGQARELFDFCRNYLRVLSCQPDGCEVSRFYAFELAFLGANGVAPDLEECPGCGVVTDQANAGFFAFDIAQGGLICTSCAATYARSAERRIQPATRRYLLDLQNSGSDAGLIAVPDRRVRRETGVVLHHFLVYHLAGYKLPAALDMLKEPPALTETGSETGEG
jgi:DNA repair protein RecO